MPLLVSSLEDRLRLRIGQLVMENEALNVELEKTQARLAELEKSDENTEDKS